MTINFKNGSEIKTVPCKESKVPSRGRMLRGCSQITIAIIDADLLGRKKHRFPNLACMKISGYCKDQGESVSLITEYTQDLKKYDKIFLSKVFTDTVVPEWVTNLPNIKCGGTGFFYDKAPALPYEIEHHMPDYHLYDDWVNEKLNSGGKRKDYAYYLDYSIGFMTRGCFRQCQFCVNKNYTRVLKHSSLSEFLDESRPKICLLDDNFLGSPDWKAMLTELQKTGKKFQFKQGLDERILTDEKCELLFRSKYDGDFIFAFDNIEDRETIEKKAKLIRHHCKNKGQNIKFYVLCGFDRNNKYDIDFWSKDIDDLFERIFILAKYNFKPYIMRYEKYKESPYYGTYVNIACWCNQPNFFYNFSYTEFCKKDDLRKGGKGTSATWRYYIDLLKLDLKSKKYINVIPKTVVEDYENW